MTLAIPARSDCGTIHLSWGQIVYFSISDMLKYRI